MLWWVFISIFFCLQYSFDFRWLFHGNDKTKSFQFFIFHTFLSLVIVVVFVLIAVHLFRLLLLFVCYCFALHSTIVRRCDATSCVYKCKYIMQTAMYIFQHCHCMYWLRWKAAVTFNCCISSSRLDGSCHVSPFNSNEMLSNVSAFFFLFQTSNSFIVCVWFSVAKAKTIPKEKKKTK